MAYVRPRRKPQQRPHRHDGLDPLWSIDLSDRSLASKEVEHPQVVVAPQLCADPVWRGHVKGEPLCDIGSRTALRAGLVELPQTIVHTDARRHGWQAGRSERHAGGAERREGLRLLRARHEGGQLPAADRSA